MKVTMSWQLRRPPNYGAWPTQSFSSTSAASRAIVTENIEDFAVLSSRRIAAGRPHAGLVFTSPRRFNRATIAYPGNLIDALRQFLQSPPIGGDSWKGWL